MNSFSYSQMFTNKVYRHPIKQNKVPERCWKETSVDLFGPLPSKNHIVVIQDLASRYSIAKLVQSTNPKSTISVLEDVCDTFDNLIRQKSDNGPRPNSQEMENFSKYRNNEQAKASLIMPKRLWKHLVKQWKLVNFKIKEKKELALHFW